MLARFPIGVSDFCRVVTDDYIFVDKTLLIKEIIDDGASAIVITRPRRFGKTLNLSMLQYFFQKRSQRNFIYPMYKKLGNIFENLEISKDNEFCKKHQEQYPVIFISFKDIKSSKFEEAFTEIKALIADLYNSHSYLLEGSLLSSHEKDDYQAIMREEAPKHKVLKSLRQLSMYLSRSGEKSTILLIDEYDTPIQEGYLNGYYDEIIEVMRGILGSALKDNSYISRAVVTGITRVSQESLFSGLNNLIVFSLLRNECSQYFGFLESEVKQLIKNSQSNASIADIKDWYNGYAIGNHTIYNPWSILCCLDNEGELKPYWLNTSNNALIGVLLSEAGTDVKAAFEDLLQGKVIERPITEDLVFRDIKTDPAALWSLLFYAGYLKVLSTRRTNRTFLSKLAIVNKEVGFVYDKMIENWYSRAVNLESYDQML